MTPRLPSPNAAYLRVYEPLAAFPAEERARWAAYAARADGRAERLAAEHRRALRDLVGVPPLPVPVDESEEAFVLEAAHEVLICPVQTRLRSWVAFGEFRAGLPDQLLHAFVPPAAVAQADAEHEVWGAKEVGARLRIRTAPAAVPIHWFVMFSGRDRQLRLGGPDRSLVYQARMSAARRRVARGLRTLRAAIGDVSYVAELQGLAEWLEEFHPRSWVEVDYGGLVHLLDDAQLRADCSAQDVAAAIAALASGDRETAAAAYETLVDRWAAVRALEHAN